jgi:hypothetical protein
MTDVLKIKLPEGIQKLSQYRNERLNESLSLLYSIENVSGILLGGSLSYKQDVTKSDVDLFCLVNLFDKSDDVIIKQLSSLSDIDVVIYQGYFPWTENLYTVYFTGDIDFTLDISLVNSDNAETFFWEPDGLILFDKLGIIEKSRNVQTSKPDYTKQPLLKTNPFTMAVISIKKIEKNLSRGHLWNAIDQVRNLRRYLMQVVRLYVIKNSNFLGRVDREIEDVMPEEINCKFSNTIPMYKSQDIAAKTILLSQIAEELIDNIAGTKEEFLKDWILKHLHHEKDKLLNHLI